MVDVEGQLLAVSLHHDGAAVLHGVAYLGVSDAAFFHQFLELKLVLVAHLDDDAGILGKERLDDVAVGTDVVQVDVHAATGVGEAHLQ